MKVFDNQNLWLCNLFEKSLPKRREEEVKVKNREASWKYFFNYKGEKKQICLNFLLKLLQISRKRIRTLQTKIINGESVCDNRGKNSNKNKIPQEIWNLLHSMLSEMRTTNSHYKTKSMDLKYFEDTDLNMKKLYKVFLSFYKDETQNDLKLEYSTFAKYFNLNCNYSFK